MPTTLRASLAAITPTARANLAGQQQGVNLASLLAQLDTHAGEMQILLKQIIALHPTGGGDASNLTTLQSLLTSLA